MKGKYAWPFFSFIWPTTMLCTVAYIVSWAMDQEFDTILPLLLDITLIKKTRYPPNVKYSPILVNERDKSPKIGASRLIKSRIENWSKGLIILKTESTKDSFPLANWVYLIFFSYMRVYGKEWFLPRLSCAI